MADSNTTPSKFEPMNTTSFHAADDSIPSSLQKSLLCSSSPTLRRHAESHDMFLGGLKCCLIRSTILIRLHERRSRLRYSNDLSASSLIRPSDFGHEGSVFRGATTPCSARLSAQKLIASSLQTSSQSLNAISLPHHVTVAGSRNCL